MIWETAIGTYRLYAIEDGWLLGDPAERFPEADPGVWTDELLTDGALRVSFGCFLLTDDTRTVMIDAGIGSGMTALPGDATGGQLSQALAMIGVRPEDVQAVIHTHLHLDHIAGIRTSTGGLLLSNASYRVHRAELDYWMHDTEHSSADAIRGVLDGLVDDGLVEPFEGEPELVPGVTARETPGHTPGHISVEIASQGVQALIVGDVFHHPVQITDPELGVPFDIDPERARQTRRQLADELAGSGTMMAAGHFPRPGIGYVETSGDRRVFVTGTPMQVG